MSRSTLLLLLALILPVAESAAQTMRPVQPAADSTRPPTCRSGLQQYTRREDVPVPYDTLLPVLPSAGGATQGMQPIRNLNDFHESLLRAAAAIGATGYITFGAGSETGGMQSLGRLLPVYVPSDTARVRAACRSAPPGRDSANRYQGS